MLSPRALRVFAIGFFVIVGSLSAFADPLEVYDEIILASVVRERCHLKIDGEDRLDRKIVDEKLNSIGKAPFDQLWKKLDAENPIQHEKNGMQADFILKKRTENLAFSAYPKLIDEVGCSALEQRARNPFALIQ